MGMSTEDDLLRAADACLQVAAERYNEGDMVGFVRNVTAAAALVDSAMEQGEVEPA